MPSISQTLVEIRRSPNLNCRRDSDRVCGALVRMLPKCIVGLAVPFAYGLLIACHHYIGYEIPPGLSASFPPSQLITAERYRTKFYSVLPETSQPGQERIPGQHESRNPHSDEWGPRHDRARPR